MSIWSYFLRGKRAKNGSAIEDGTLPETGRNGRRINKDDISLRLAGKILEGQQSVATFLNMKAKGISKFKMRLLFVGFLMAGVIYCLYLILSAVLIFL